MASAFEERIATTSKARTSLKPTLTVLPIPSYHSSASRQPSNGNYLDCDLIYNSAALEKTARGAELSAIKRALSKDTIVIADDLNYIKGFRYQLWCEAKAAGTRCCVVHCAAREDEVRKWNCGRLRQWAQLKGEDLPEEDDRSSSISGHVENAADARHLLPESHTALYGDRIPDMPSRSRSSSMDGDDGEEVALRPSTFIEESLKSFALADRDSIRIGEATSQETTKDNSVPSTTLEESPTTTTIFDFLPPTSPPYSSETLQSLLMRYEPPSPFSRWDTPLFTIPACDPVPPVSAIWDALFPPRSANLTRRAGVSEVKATVKHHAATVLPQATGADALQVLERITAHVVTQIMARAKEHPDLSEGGGEVEINSVDTTATLSIPPGTILSLPMLQRLRRRFTQIQRGGIAHGRGYVQGEKAVGESFVRYLNGEIGA